MDITSLVIIIRYGCKTNTVTCNNDNTCYCDKYCVYRGNCQRERDLRFKNKEKIDRRKYDGRIYDK